MFRNRLELIAKGLFGDSFIKYLSLQKFRRNNHRTLELLKNNHTLKDSKSGKRCFIIGNGPSLKSMDLSLLANDDVFTCNYFSQSEDFLKLHPLAHFIMDVRFFENEKPSNLSPMQYVFDRCLSNNVRYIFINSEAAPFLASYNINREQMELHYIAQNPNVQLSSGLTLTDFIPSFPTVIHSAICAAWYMGYQTIYLIGCDCTGFTTYANAYETKSITDNYGFNVSESSQRIINKNMTSSPIQQELRWYAQIFDDYERLYYFCNKTNRTLVNLTNGGVLNNIPRGNYIDILRP